MRQIGTLPRNLDPRRLIDHLTAIGVSTRVDDRPEGWVVWVHDEDKLARAKQELDEYVARPDDPRYDNAKQVAEEVRRASLAKDRQYQKNVRNSSASFQPARLRRPPLTTLLMIISACVYVIMKSSGNQVRIINALAFAPLGVDEFGQLRMMGLSAIERGEVWRLITPIFLHFGIPHIVFNMWALWSFGRVIEYLRGTRTLGLIVFLSALASNAGQYAYNVLAELPLVPFGGMSGVVYALFGYVWMKGRVQPEQGMVMTSSSVQMMLFWLVLCFTGAVGNIANGAHVVGLIVGMLFGLARL